MRRVVLVLAVMASAVLLASGVAWAVNEVGTNGPDTLRGTNSDDNLSGRSGDDTLLGLDGRDNLLGGPGKDNVIAGSERRLGGGDKNLEGGPGNDRIFAGPGFDRVLADTKDVVAPDCEEVWIVQGSRTEVLRQQERFFASLPQSFYEGLPPFP